MAGRQIDSYVANDLGSDFQQTDDLSRTFAEAASEEAKYSYESMSMSSESMECTWGRCRWRTSEFSKPQTSAFKS